MTYIIDGKVTEITQHDNLPIDRELAHEIPIAFRRRTGTEFTQARMLLLPSEAQNDIIRAAGIAVQARRRRRA